MIPLPRFYLLPSFSISVRTLLQLPSTLLSTIAAMADAEKTNERVSLESKTSKIAEEQLEQSVLDTYLEQFPLIRDKSPEERKKIEKSLVRKLDWKFLPCITLMLLMKYVQNLPCFSSFV